MDIKKVIHNDYYMVYQPNHPKAGSNGYVKEHRLIMEQFVNRYLREDEVIHHINHIPTDNRLENLVILSPSEHSKLHGRQPQTDEGKRRIALALKGNKHWLGKTHTPETKLKMSQARKRYWEAR